jgi:two-component system sensor histidine kinase BaeS
MVMDATLASRRIAQFGIAGLLLSILGFAAALMLTIDRASLHFQRYEASQAQIAAMLRVRTELAMSNYADVRTNLEAYRRLTKDEERLDGGDDVALAAEQAWGRQFEALIPKLPAPTARARLEQTVSAALEGEGDEARAEQQAMRVLRLRTGWLTAGLMVAAVASAVLGGLGLLWRNRRLAQEVARRTETISAIDASRRLFFAKASHELRTPVTVMRGEAEVALANPGAEAEALQHVVAQADFLEHRVAELLALAQAEDGQLRLSYDCCNLDGVARDAIAAASGYATSNRIALRLEVHEPVMIRCDCRWLTQAVVAILDNAIKFSNAGGTVEVAVDRLSITVSDQGIGLMPESIPRVFDAFYTTDAGARGGSGLGLALARWVVEQHGGTIAAENLERGGCRIRIELPEAV